VTVAEKRIKKAKRRRRRRRNRWHNVLFSSHNGNVSYRLNQHLFQGMLMARGGMAQNKLILVGHQHLTEKQHHQKRRKNPSHEQSLI